MIDVEIFTEKYDSICSGLLVDCILCKLNGVSYEDAVILNEKKNLLICICSGFKVPNQRMNS